MRQACPCSWGACTVAGCVALGLPRSRHQDPVDSGAGWREQEQAGAGLQAREQVCRLWHLWREGKKEGLSREHVRPQPQTDEGAEPGLLHQRAPCQAGMASIGGPDTFSHWLRAAWGSMASAHTWGPFREVAAGTKGQLCSVTGSPGDLKGTLPWPPPSDPREHCPVTWHLPGFAAPESSRGPLWSRASKRQS